MTMTTLIRALAAFLILTAVPALAAPVTVSGTVTYRERLALPPDAVLHVSLVDLDDGSAVLGASASIPARGQVPIAFVLSVHSDTDPFDGQYGLVAEISSGGAILFRNPVATPVAPPSTAILVNHLTAPPQPDPQPQPQPPAPPSDLLDVMWTVTSIGGRPVTGKKPLTLSIAADLRSGGFGGCNSFFTEARVDRNALAFGPAAATRMACLPEIMEQEAAYFVALAAVTAYEQDERGLRLFDGAGIPLIGLVRAKE